MVIWFLTCFNTHLLVIERALNGFNDKERPEPVKKLEFVALLNEYSC